MTAAQLLRLARAYAKYQHVSVRRVGVLAANNNMLFDRLADGKGAHSRTIEQAADWISKHWPRGVPWPADIPEPPDYPCRCEAAESSHPGNLIVACALGLALWAGIIALGIAVSRWLT